MEYRRVDREYLDEELRRLATESGIRLTGWTSADASDYQRLVQCARAAHVDTDLRNMLALRIGQHPTGDPLRAQATLTSGRTIELTFKSPEDRGTVVFGLLPPEMETRDDED